MDVSQQTDRHYMALHLITVPDAGWEETSGDINVTKMQFYDYFAPYDNITANSCFCGYLVGDPESQVKMLEAHNLMTLLSYYAVHLPPNLHQTH